MAIRDLVSYISSIISLSPVARTASANGTGVDLQNFDSAVVQVVAGTLTDGVHTPSLEDSANNSSWSAVGSGDLHGSFSVLTSDSTQEVGYIGSERYVRAVITVSGGPGTGVVAGVNIIRGNARTVPVT